MESFSRAVRRVRAPIYTEDDLRKIYNEITSASFADVSHETQLIFKDFGDVGMSTPFKKVYININEINKYNWPEDVVRGVFAHELAHQVSYKRRSFIGRFLFLWNYLFSKSRKRRVEKEADEIAIERGYGKEIVQGRIYQFNFGDRKRAEKEKKVYLSVGDLEKLIEEKKIS
ncbi:MAG: hypothetical protein ACE5JC_09935 [Candidatus Zixiibacteriota bacterium]